MVKVYYSNSYYVDYEIEIDGIFIVDNLRGLI